MTRSDHSVFPTARAAFHSGDFSAQRQFIAGWLDHVPVDGATAAARLSFADLNVSRKMGGGGLIFKIFSSGAKIRVPKIFCPFGALTLETALHFPTPLAKLHGLKR